MNKCTSDVVMVVAKLEEILWEEGITDTCCSISQCTLPLLFRKRCKCAAYCHYTNRKPMFFFSQPTPACISRVALNRYLSALSFSSLWAAYRTHTASKVIWSLLWRHHGILCVCHVSSTVWRWKVNGGWMYDCQVYTDVLVNFSSPWVTVFIPLLHRYILLYHSANLHFIHNTFLNLARFIRCLFLCVCHPWNLVHAPLLITQDL